MALIQRILVPTDFSDPSDAALQYAVDFARNFGARLYLLHVPGATGENFEANFPIGRFEALAKERLAGVLSPEDIDRLRPEYAVRVGKPADEIVRYAEAREVDVIIMGTHGRTGLAHLLMGSVAEHVVRAAPCPVFLVRGTKKGAAARVPAPASVRASR